MRTRSTLSFKPLLAASLLLAACQPGPPAAPTASSPPLSRPAPTAAPSASAAAEAEVVVSGDDGFSDPAAAVRNISRLYGTVWAPSQLIGQGGAGLVPKTKLYRLQDVPDQYAWAGVRVELQEASGAPVTGADGQPLVATTDATGRYKFDGPLPAHKLVVSVALPDGQTRFLAVAPLDENGGLQVDLDLVSTMTTGYILSRYVAPAKDPNMLLEHLPSPMESTARVQLAHALAESGAAAPTQLNAPALDQAVDGLRARSTDLDRQMKAIEAVLIAAGQSDLGAGQLATAVPLHSVKALLAAPDGSLYIAGARDRRVWRLTPDGKLTTLAGIGTPGDVEGLPAAQAGLTFPFDLAFDPSGRLLILDQTDMRGATRLVRIENDGHAHELWHSGDNGALALAWGNEALLLKDGDPRSKLLGVDAQGTANIRQRFTDEDTDALVLGKQLGVDAQGRVYVASEGLSDDNSSAGGGPAVYRFTPSGNDARPAANVLTPLLNQRDKGLSGLSLDAAGNIYYLTADRQLMSLAPGSDTPVNLLDHLPEALSLHLMPLLKTPDGVLLGQHTQVYRIKDGQVTRIAGVDDGVAADSAELVMQVPQGVGFATDGALLVADSVGARVLRIGADQRISLVAGTGESGWADDDGTATRSELASPQDLCVDAGGAIYLVDEMGANSRLRRITPDGTLHTLYTTSGANIKSLVLAADGSAYFVKTLTGKNELWRWSKDGASKLAKLDQLEAVTLGRDGMPVVKQGDRLSRWNAGTLETLVEDAALSPRGRALAVDALGRIYVCAGKFGDPGVVLRWAPDAGVSTLAGPGGRFFSGQSVDDSLLRPSSLAFDTAGNLYISDSGHKQVKRITAGSL